MRRLSGLVVLEIEIVRGKAGICRRSCRLVLESADILGLSRRVLAPVLLRLVVLVGVHALGGPCGLRGSGSWVSRVIVLILGLLLVFVHVQFLLGPSVQSLSRRLEFFDHCRCPLGHGDSFV